MDAYYASIEQRDDVSLRGKPVVVGGPPHSRSVVTTASYEARAFGIRSAIPCAQAFRLCPHAIFVPPRFSVYKEVSMQIRDIFYQYTDKVEPLSLDEAYLDVSETLQPGQSATAVAQEIRQRIKETTQLTASAGVGPSKFIAKLASDMRKPDGLTVIKPEHVDAFMAALPVGKFHGVGKATEERLNRIGLFTGADIRALGKEDMQRHFGKTGAWLFEIANGIDNRPVASDWIRKSLGAEETFDKDLDDRDAMRAVLYTIAEEVNRRLTKAELSGKTITLKVRYTTFERISRSRTLPRFTCDIQQLYEVASELLETTDAGPRPVRLLGISVSQLNNVPPAFGNQLQLDFENQEH
jgi:DNA polymerase-4